MHRVKWTTDYGQKRNLVGKIIDRGRVIHLQPTGTFKQTYQIIIEKKLTEVPAKDGHFIINKDNITIIEDYPKKAKAEAT